MENQLENQEYDIMKDPEYAVFARALEFLYRKYLEKRGIRADIRITRRDPAELSAKVKKAAAVTSENKSA